MQFAPIGLNAPTSKLHVKRIVLKKVIFYKYKTFTLFARCTNMFYVQSALRTIRQLFYY